MLVYKDNNQAIKANNPF